MALNVLAVYRKNKNSDTNNLIWPMFKYHVYDLKITFVYIGVITDILFQNIDIATVS